MQLDKTAPMVQSQTSTTVGKCQYKKVGFKVLGKNAKIKG